jgi:hypothetical protein
VSGEGIADVCELHAAFVCPVCRPVSAAPGPQQPDEVCGAPCEHGGRESTRRRSTSDLGWQGHCNRVTGGGHCWQHRPAAPSTQPSEKDWRTETVEEQAARYGLPVELLNARVTFTDPAQPVRDAEEGRR